MQSRLQLLTAQTQPQPPDTAHTTSPAHNEVELSHLGETRPDGTPHAVVEKTAITSSKLSWPAFKQWWSFYIDPNLICRDATGSLVHDPRDFLALERTHLAYIRTSNALALFGVVLAQLFILNGGGRSYGRGLAVTAYALAILLTVSSAIRIMYAQNRIIAGRMPTAARLFCVVAGAMTLLIIVMLVIDSMI